MRWTGAKPKTGLPAAARSARYRLLAQAARANGALHILTAHTRDDQAETLLMRLVRGSGIAGLAAMARQSERDGVLLARPFLHVAKSRLIATLNKAKVGLRRRSDQPRHAFYPAADPRDDAGARRRRRRRPKSGAAGVAAGPRQRGGRGSGRWRRALSRADGPRSRRSRGSTPERLPRMPEEIRLRLLLRAIDRFGHEGPANSARSKPCCRLLDRAVAEKRRVASQG